jgi:ATP-dependent DNA helicase RecG
VDVLGCFDEDEVRMLGEQGVHTISDLLQRPPTDHLRASRVSIEGITLDEPVTVRGHIRWRVMHLSPHGRRWEVGIGREDSPPLLVRWFRRAPRGWDTWEVGHELGVYGEAREAEAGTVMYEAEPLGLHGKGSGLVPVYGVEGIDDATMRDAIARALVSIEDRLDDWLPPTIRDQNRLLPLDEAFRDAHFPANATGRGRFRLAFDELFSIQVGVAWRSGRGKAPRGISHKPVHTGIGQIEAQHQILLDDVQEMVFSEIRRDLVRPTPMNRPLQGDVGSGKGLVAQMAALMVVGGGCQAAMISPDSLAAERRYLHIDPILRSIGVKTMLVTEEHLDRGQLDAIRRGEAQIVFGTDALLDKAVNWKRLGLITVEERGPYGTLDLEALSRRGPRPDLLVIPRAPIPSSLAFTVFGDFDVSTLHASLHRPVRCEVFENAARHDAYAPLREAIEAGRQGYVVFPVRDGRDLLSVEDAMRTASALQTNLLPGARIGVYSSEMSREERGRIFEDFQHRRVDVLVCTTYIEDSPAVTNATAMVVEYADLHDLVRLHRLRAHVSGGYKPGNCSFVSSEAPASEQEDRLGQLVRERDGFRLAELDLRFRGAAALLGERATEAPMFAWADPPEDRGLFMRARASALELVRRDPELRSAGEIASTVNLRWSDWLGQALPKVVERKKKGDGRRRRRKRR